MLQQWNCNTDARHVWVLRSDDRARRVSEARSQRAEEYRHSRQLHAVRLQAAEREAAPDGAPADTEPSHVVIIVKADVQVRCFHPLSSTLILIGCFVWGFRAWACVHLSTGMMLKLLRQKMGLSCKLWMQPSGLLPNGDVCTLEIVLVSAHLNNCSACHV